MEGNRRRQTDRPAVVTPWSCSVVQCGRDMMKDTDVREQEDLEEVGGLSKFTRLLYTGNAELHVCHAVKRPALTRHGAFLDILPFECNPDRAAGPCVMKAQGITTATTDLGRAMACNHFRAWPWTLWARCWDLLGIYFWATRTWCGESVH